MDDIIKNDLAHFYSYIPPHLRLPAPPSVGTACLPVGRGPVGRWGWGNKIS